MATTTQKPILISGAGICALLLGRSLLRAGIPFLIFERDKDVSFRAQGYRLRMSPEGLDAIEQVLGPEGWQTFWDACGKTGGAGFTGLDALTAEVLDETKRDHGSQAASDAKDAGAETKKPALKETIQSRDGKVVGISRGDMRKIFMAGCESHIRWGHQVTGYERTANGVKAVFKDGSTSEEGELLVGGEGIYSKVARQVSGGRLKVYDSGARGIHGEAPTTAFKQLGEGVWRFVDDSRANGRVFCITNVRSGDMDDPNIQFGWTMGAQPGVIHAPDDNYSLIGKPAADIARDLAKNWHPRIKPLIDQMDVNEAAFWKITCSTPSGVPDWPNDPRVTVIGDAAHSMTPAGGIGANTAVRDSALLGKLLADAGGYKEGVTAEYEKKMRVYASEAVGQSYGMATSQFGIMIEEGKTPTV